MNGKELSPAYLFAQAEKKRLFPFYLFYGENEFLLEKAIEKIKDTLIPEDLRDLNMHIFYGDELKSDFMTIINGARSVPFISDYKLVIVRRTEKLSASALEGMIPYLERPVSSTCLIYVSSKPDFRKKFYSKIKEKNRAVNFKELYDHQIVPWIKNRAREIGLDITNEACLLLQQIAGNNLSDLSNELDKLFVRFEGQRIDARKVEEMVSSSRNFTIFELVDEISLKNRKKALLILDRFLQEEGIEGKLQVLGMLIRQAKLIGKAKALMSAGKPVDTRHMKEHPFVIKKVVEQSKKWQLSEIEEVFKYLYQADKLIKSGTRGDVVIQDLVTRIFAKEQDNNFS